MTRVKRGSIAVKRRKKIIKLAKGFRGSHSRLFIAANQQTMKSLQYSFFDRRKKKGKYRNLWIARINGFTKNLGMPYSKFIYELKNRKIDLNRKIISEIIIKDNSLIKNLINSF